MSLRMFLALTCGLAMFLLLSFAGWFIRGEIAPWHLLVMAGASLFGFGLCVGFVMRGLCTW